jgi:hypothetical protein
MKREDETRKSGADVRSPSVPIFTRTGERKREKEREEKGRDDETGLGFGV